MAGLKENQTYKNPLLSASIDATKALSASLPQRKPQTDLSRFSNLGNLAQARAGGQMPQQAPPPTAPQRLQQLGTETTPYGGSTRFEGAHPGVDIANKIGTPIQSQAPGTVTKVVSGKQQGSPGYGNYVEVKDEFGNTHRYSHLHKSFVEVGQTLPQYSTLGTMGASGQTYSTSGGTGSHLDYRIFDLYGKYVNPYKYLKEKYYE